MAADYASAIIGLAGMVAQALAHKKAIKQEKQDTRRDTSYDIAMENAASLGAPGARYQQQAHDALTHNSRLNRIPVDYGASLGMLGHSLAGAFDGSGSDADAALAKPLPNAQLDYTLQLPGKTPAQNPIYPGGSSPSVTGTVGAPQIDLRAPNWNALKLDEENYQ